ncbi:MAG TPA: UPF0182 family protein, partial [Nitrospiria bacterium]|nr:UPF0182 family protein [Nitrospiria bacterium]
MIRTWVIVLTALAVTLFSGNLLSLYVDWLWFAEIEQTKVFLVTLGTKFKLGLAAGLVFFLFALFNFRLAHRYRNAGQWHRTQEWLELPFRTQLDPYISKVIPAFAFLLALVGGLNGAAQWENFLLARDASEFGQAEPVFGKDYGFYVFTLPFLIFLQRWLTGLVLLSAIFSAALYVYHGGLGITQRGAFIDPFPKRHLLWLAGAFILLKSAGYRFSAYELLFTQRGVVSGAVYADVFARIPVMNAMMVLSIVIAIAVILGGYGKGWRIPIGAIALLFITNLLGATFYPDLLHRFRVQPNEIVLESPYIKRNIEATRFAFGLNNIEEKEFPAEENLTLDDLSRNDLTISNVRLWDHAPLLDTYRQLQQIRTYYDFQGVDNDRYVINGRYRQVMLSPRELSYGNLPGGENWINEHLTYTHGYGVTLGPVNRISEEGLPEFMIQDIPPRSDIDLHVTRPEIYFGELTNHYVFVNTRALEFDYPLGDKNEYTDYTGKGGVPVDSIIRKLVFSAFFGTAKILLSNDIHSESRVLYHRNIRDRVSSLAPFLAFDGDPYMVITQEGRLVWVLDGYTTSDRIPYSQQAPFRGLGNYIRNSVKGVIDAYDGTVDLYINDPDDPVIQTYDRIFPGLFKPAEAMPEYIRKHLRYPQDLFTIQARLFATYHMQDPQIFYNREDLWNIPAQKEQSMEPYYTIMKLPDEEKEEFILMIPYTPANRDNMAAWLAARADAPNY